MLIRWTEPAARDLTTICDYVKENGSTTAARSVALSIHARIASLAEFPEMGRPGRYRTFGIDTSEDCQPNRREPTSR